MWTSIGISCCIAKGLQQSMHVSPCQCETEVQPKDLKVED